jgi:Fe-Mn family superoxide dismutase
MTAKLKNPPASADNAAAAANEKPRKHVLPRLGYDYADLQPCIDVRTMTVHHDLHHGTYVDKLNLALEDFPDMQQYTALWLLLNLDKVPEKIRDAVHHNAGGHVNHSLFWRVMKPAGGGEPSGELAEAINRDFGSFEKFKTAFEKAGSAVFGSGWVWLVRCHEDGGKLSVVTTAGHDHPLMQGQFPLLLNDVWEHAYYLHYENQRGDYLKAWWSVTDWKEVSRRYELSNRSAEKIWEAEGGHLLAEDIKAEVAPLAQ